MKAVILAGGRGTRIAEETNVRPKPMIEVGGKPILWHIMKHLSSHGIQDFVVCLGYLGYVVKEYFANYYLHSCDVSFDIASNSMEVHRSAAEPWRVTLVDTGEETMTGGRLRRVARYLDKDEAFLFTYGDGLSDVDIRALVRFHDEAGAPAVVTAVQPPGRYGALEVNEARVTGFREKPAGDGGWINGGFFVLRPDVLELIAGDQTPWEREPLDALARKNELAPFFHEGFWHPIDTLRDLSYVQGLWESGQAPWRSW